MAYLWRQDHDNRWHAGTLEENRCTRVSDAEPSAVPPLAPALVRTVTSEGAERWVVVGDGASGVRVNGQAFPGIRLLADKDEISVPPRGRFFFSSERLACVEPFDGSREVSCPRCLRPIKPGDPAVRCPNANCGALHHQMERWWCWTHEESCQLCDQLTRFDAGFRWTPEKL